MESAESPLSEAGKNRTVAGQGASPTPDYVSGFAERLLSGSQSGPDSGEPHGALLRPAPEFESGRPIQRGCQPFDLVESSFRSADDHASGSLVVNGGDDGVDLDAVGLQKTGEHF
jgi:hypothetical protein